MEKNEFIKLLPKLFKENDEIKGAILSILAGVVATKDDIKTLIEHSDKRFEAMDKHFEAVDKRFETMQNTMDKRFEAVDKRFETMQNTMDKRFEAVDKRFETMQNTMDRNYSILKSIKQSLGKPFEQFAKNVIVRLLKSEGQTGINLKSKKIEDPNEFISKGSTEVEIDGLSLDPPIIIEITSVLKTKQKIAKFLKKKQFVEKEYEREFRGFFVAASSEFSSEELGEITVELRKHNCELINL